MNKRPHTLMEDYKDIYQLDEYGFPLANSAKRIWDVAKLAGREAERNVANAIGQGTKVVTAYADASNPFVSPEQMDQHSAEIDANIKTTLDSIDKRYADAIEALWQALQLTDTQVFMFMLSPSLYLGTKVAPKALGLATNVLLTAANNPYYTNPLIDTIRSVEKTATRATTSKGPGANQAASYSTGYGGGYDFGADYGGDYY